MFRASACFIFIICIALLAEFSLTLQAVGLNGLPAYVTGLAVFVLILTAAVMLVSAINDRMNK